GLAVAGTCGKALAADRAPDRAREGLAQRVEFRPDAGADLAHTRLEPAHVEDFEVARDECWGRHRFAPRSEVDEIENATIRAALAAVNDDGAARRFRSADLPRSAGARSRRRWPRQIGRASCRGRG